MSHEECEFQVADGNNICYNVLDPEPLASLCQSFIDSPEGLAISSSNRLVAGCCQQPYVPANVTVCGPGTQLPPPFDGTLVSTIIIEPMNEREREIL